MSEADFRDWIAARVRVIPPLPPRVAWFRSPYWSPYGFCLMRLMRFLGVLGERA
jgi:hypothetical protein